MKNYEIERRPDGVHVLVTENGRPLHALTPDPSLRLRQYSPTFELFGDGMKQLALAILLDWYLDTMPSPVYAQGLAVDFHGAFKRDFLVTEPRDSFVIEGRQLNAWVASVPA